jgi:hypothetical protein
MNWDFQLALTALLAYLHIDTNVFRCDARLGSQTNLMPRRLVRLACLFEAEFHRRILCRDLA